MTFVFTLQINKELTGSVLVPRTCPFAGWRWASLAFAHAYLCFCHPSSLQPMHVLLRGNVYNFSTTFILTVFLVQYRMIIEKKRCALKGPWFVKDILSRKCLGICELYRKGARFLTLWSNVYFLLERIYGGIYVVAGKQASQIWRFEVVVWC
jgi:hypothetical protein